MARPTTTTTGPFGLFYHLSNDYPAHAIPLQGVDVECTIRDTTALVLFSQKYHHEVPLATSILYSGLSIKAQYSFPVPARAAVCAFVMIKEDGTRVVGIVEEKEEAKKAYETAKKEGKLTSLMEMSTPDVFTVSVGNILPNETVIIEVTYAVELTEGEENDSLRFHLPVHIGSRYGIAPLALSPAHPSAFFKLKVSIEMSRPIAKISCPSHTVGIELGPLGESLSNIPDTSYANYARVLFTSEETLSTDFVLELKSSNVDAPRCIAERHPTNDTLAIALTVVPKFKLPDVRTQEFIFVVDRSGSMDGHRIDTAKKALVVLLRSLPTEGTFFNVLSFGSWTEQLWMLGSKPYDQTTLDEATTYVDSMRANFAGTEIAKAFKAAFEKRKNDIPTSVFVLTDGDSWDLPGTLSQVRTAVNSASPSAPIRVFTLGIGSSASTAMVEGIARVGNGISMFVSDGESFTGKTARLLKAARAPLLSNVRIDWGIDVAAETDDTIENDDDFEVVHAEPPKTTRTLSLFDTTIDPLAPEMSTTGAAPKKPIVLPPSPQIQQAPHVLRDVFPGSRLRVYAILSPTAEKNILPPSKITLRASVEGEPGLDLDLDVPVVYSQLASPSASVHVLAAKKLIQDLEDGVGLEGEEEEMKKAKIVRLGKAYSLASKYTSFVAVDEYEIRISGHRRIVVDVPEEGEETVSKETTPARRKRGRAIVASKRLRKHARVQPMIASVSADPSGEEEEVDENVSEDFWNEATTVSQACFLDCEAEVSDEDEDEDDMQMQMADVDNAALPTYTDAWAAPQSWSIEPDDDNQSEDDDDHGSNDARSLSPFRVFSLDTLARLQFFDGSFDVQGTLSLCSLSENAEKTLQDILAVIPIRMDTLAATVLAMASMKKRLAGDEEEWESMYEKARIWVIKQLAHEGKDNELDVGELVEKVWVVVGGQ